MSVPSAPPSLDNQYSILGEGGFGLVFSPALPNNTTNYPGDVTKLFFHKDNLKKAVKNINTIKNKIPSLALNLHPYKKKYTIQNLPKSIRNILKGKKSSLTNTSSIYPLRMPNLGISCYDINKSPNIEYYKQVRAIDYKILCVEIMKLFKVVEAIYTAGFIHGDIRPTNVLCNTSTGILTIIDFDWLKLFKDFFETYPTYFYSFPPEFAFVFGIDGKIDFNNYITSDPDSYILSMKEPDQTKNIEKIKKYLETANITYPYHAANAIDYFMRTTIQNPTIQTNFKNFMKKVKTNPLLDKNKMVTKFFQYQLFEQAKKYIDLYGLGLSIQDLLSRAWYRGTNLDAAAGKINIGGVTNVNEFETFKKLSTHIFTTLLPQIMRPNMYDRFSIESVIQLYDNVLTFQLKEFYKPAQVNPQDELERIQALAPLNTAILHNPSDVEAAPGAAAAVQPAPQSGQNSSNILGGISSVLENFSNNGSLSPIGQHITAVEQNSLLASVPNGSRRRNRKRTRKGKSYRKRSTRRRN